MQIPGEIQILAVTAASIGFFHTLMGPDHYLPFVVMSRARGWSVARTALITFACGLGHVLGSVVIGSIGVALGVALQRVVAIESFRGNIAAWGLIIAGLLYTLWAIRRLWKEKKHEHGHDHENGSHHAHVHSHCAGHVHVHEAGGKISITPWVLFTIFVFGPCEPLIPLLMYPAARDSMFGLVFVTAVFSVTTIATMLAVVFVGLMGFRFVPMKRLERYNHVMAGSVIFISGIAIQLLGL